MVFADLKNDFVFRRVFANHADLMTALLNDLLDRTGERAIESLTYLPPEQAPEVPGAKLSILDVKCVDRSGHVFVVEMQLLHIKGFLNRVVYNACKAYVGQLAQGGHYKTLANVVAVSICDFTIWPDGREASEDGVELRAVPMVSRWRVTEAASGARDALGQVEYVFLELPKLRDSASREGAPAWAWLFRNSESLHDIPTDLPEPHRRALELANEATFSAGEHDAYRKVRDEIEQARQLAEDSEEKGLAKPACRRD